MKNEMEKFFTRSIAEAGKQIALSYPDGTPSPHWIKVRGVDSDAYAKASAAERKHLLQEQAKAADNDRELAEEVFEASKHRLLTALVADWSFDQECTPENVAALLREAPQIAEKINLLSADRSFFFGLGAKNSASSQDTTPSSPSPRRKAQPSRTKSTSQK